MSWTQILWLVSLIVKFLIGLDPEDNGNKMPEK